MTSTKLDAKPSGSQSPPGSPVGSFVHHRRGMTRSGQKSADGGDALFNEKDEYDALEKSGAEAPTHTHYATLEKSTLQVGTVALLVFFTVSGGPLGSEDAVCLRVPKSSFSY